jgi:hypothetical protein
MNLTPKSKAIIDAKSYESLLRHWRFASAGNNWFTGGTGKYWQKRMTALKAQDPGEAVAASKRIGWDRP